MYRFYLVFVLVVISPGTRLMYPGEGLYRFKIEIHGGGNDTYLVKYYYNNGRNTLSRVLSKDNEFSTEDGLRLEGNNELTLTIMNQSTKEFYTVNDSANLTFPYVTSAYNITANYVFQDSHKQFIPSNNLIFMDDVATSGLMLAVNYNIAVQLQDSSTEIEYTDWENRNILINHDGMHITDVDGITTTEEFDIKIASNSAGILYLPLASDIHSFLSSSENAAFKQLTLIINSQLSDETEPMEFARFNFFDNLIPNGLFLNIKTNAGKLYDNVTSASTASLVNQITIGDIGFKVTPYNGSLDTLPVTHKKIIPSS